MSGEYEFGNARLRARRSERLRRADLERLLDRDVEGILVALTRTAWRPSVEAAAARATGLRCVLEAARRHLATTLSDLRRFYTGEARLQVDALLGRWDRRNLVTVLRGVARGRPTDEILSTVVPAGHFGEALLRSLAREDDVRGVVDLLVTLGEPACRALLGAWPTWSATHDLAALERALMAWHAESLMQARDILDPAVVETLLLDQDRTEILVALRVRAAREAGEELVASGEWVASQDLPGGHLGPDELWAVVRAPAATEAANALLSRPGLRRWEGPIRAWAVHDDLERLGDELDQAIHDRLVGWWARGDPLGPAPIVAFVAEVEAEVRDVRWIASSRDAGWPADEIRPRLWAA